MAKWALFIFIEVGIYYVYVYRYYKKKWVFHISLAFFLICPFIKVGTGGDFCMRASIPALVVLYCMVARSLKMDMEKRKYICCCGCLLILIMGGITPMHEIGRSIHNTIQQYQEYGEINNPVNDEKVMFLGGNLCYSFWIVSI